MTKETREALEVLFKGIGVGLAVVGFGGVLISGNWLGMIFFAISSVTAFYVANTFTTRR